MDNEDAGPLVDARKAAAERDGDTRPDPDTRTQPVDEPRDGRIDHFLAALAMLEQEGVEKGRGAARAPF